jgi:hypothetical protein
MAYCGGEKGGRGEGGRGEGEKGSGVDSEAQIAAFEDTSHWNRELFD